MQERSVQNTCDRECSRVGAGTAGGGIRVRAEPDGYTLSSQSGDDAQILQLHPGSLSTPLEMSPDAE